MVKEFVVFYEYNWFYTRMFKTVEYKLSSTSVPNSLAVLQQPILSGCSKNTVVVYNINIRQNNM